jgi:hypothetical protein
MGAFGEKLALTARWRNTVCDGFWDAARDGLLERVGCGEPAVPQHVHRPDEERGDAEGRPISMIVFADGSFIGFTPESRSTIANILRRARAGTRLE